jgi:hypothetical protein
MKLRNPLIATGLAGAILVGSAAVAFAQPAVVSRSVNLRSGPGTFYRVIDHLHWGEQVNVEGCRRNWCYVSRRGPDGWVSASFLRAPPHRPYFNFRFDFGHPPFFPGFPGGPGGHGPGGHDHDHNHDHDHSGYTM